MLGNICKFSHVFCFTKKSIIKLMLLQRSLIVSAWLAFIELLTSMYLTWMIHSWNFLKFWLLIQQTWFYICHIGRKQAEIKEIKQWLGSSAVFNPVKFLIKLSEIYQKFIRSLSEVYQKFNRNLSEFYQKIIRILSENYQIT